jgi:hypothetical protein
MSLNLPLYVPSIQLSDSLRKCSLPSQFNPFPLNNLRNRSKDVCVEIQGNFPVGKVGISERATGSSSLQQTLLR